MYSRHAAKIGYHKTISYLSHENELVTNRYSREVPGFFTLRLGRIDRCDVRVSDLGGDLHPRDDPIFVVEFLTVPLFPSNSTSGVTGMEYSRPAHSVVG